MNTIVIEARQCPNCGKLMAAGALSGLCPACLLAQGADTQASAGDRRRFVPPALRELQQLFPQLEMVALLGSGGMGAVYKARQPALDRWVALKILPAESDGGGNFTERFNREARALARLSHPNIVAVHEFGQAGPLHYFIMEFVDGTNLRQFQQAGRLAPNEALQIIPQICEALQYAHDEGVVHRDIKPENVLLDRKGRVKIADFGLAKILGQSPDMQRLTLEGQVMGTPHYMAPEQVERPLAVDHRADIYALGVVFYEMLTGDLPLGKFPPPSRKVQIDLRLDDVVLRALENDPERRYQNASEVKSQVETIAESPEPSRRTKRRTVAAVLAGTAALVIGLVIAIVLNRNGRASKALPLNLQIAATDESTGSLIAHYPAGGAVELVAISGPSVEGNGWWRPDGTAAGDDTYMLRGLPENLNANSPVNDFVFRTVGLPAGASGPYFHCAPSANVSSGGDVLQNGRSFRPAFSARVHWPYSVARGIIRVGFGFEPWRTIVVHDPVRHSVRAETLATDPPWGIHFHKVTDTAQGLQVTMLAGARDRNWTMRLVAIDASEVEHGYAQASETKMHNMSTWTYIFRDLALTDVKDLRVQVRRLQWSEFRDVALAPRTPPDPPVRREFVPAKAEASIASSRAKDPYAASDPDAKAVFAGAGAQLEEAPQLRYLAWQEEWTKKNVKRAWRPDGTFVEIEPEISRLRDVQPALLDVSATEAGKRDPRFLHLWFSHPLFSARSLNAVMLFDENGAPIKLAGDGATSSGVRETGEATNRTHWLVSTLSPGEGANIPAVITVRLRYAFGPLERIQEVEADFRGGFSLPGAQLNAIGQGTDDRAFVALAIDTKENDARHFGVTAVMRDGREVAPTGHSLNAQHGASFQVERFNFSTPLAEIARFRIGTRPIRTMEWPNVVLQPPR